MDSPTKESKSKREKGLAVRIGKVLSHSEKVEGFSTALVYQPDREADKAKGSLYFVIEIASPSPLSADIAYNIIDIIKEEYYANPDEKPNSSFEKAIKAANEELKAIAREGERDWIGNFHAVIAAISGNKLYTVHRGTAEIHLLRGSRLLHLSEGLYTPGETPKPEETLVNILEGDLEPGDKITMSTSELFYYFSIEKLRRLIEHYSPASAAKQIADTLAEEKNVGRTSVILAELTLPELAEVEGALDETEESWIGKPEEMKKPAKKPLFPRLSPAFSKIKKSVPPEAEEPVPPEIEEEKATPEEIEEERKPAEKKKPPVPSKVEGPKEKYEVAKAPKIPRLSSQQQKALGKGALNILELLWRITKFIGLLLLVAFDTLINFLSFHINRIKKRKGGTRLLLVMGGVLVLILILSAVGITRSTGARIASRVATRSLEEAQKLRDEAKAALIYEDRTQAISLLGEAYKLAETATKNNRTKSNAESLLADVLKELDEVGAIKRLTDLKALVDFSVLTAQLNVSGREDKTVQVRELFALGGNVYSFDPANNKIYKYNAALEEAGIINSLVSTEKKLARGADASETELYFLTKPANLYLLDLSTNRLAGVPLEGEETWREADKIFAYGTNLYFLDKKNNQIWKYRHLATGAFTQIAPYFEDNSGIDLKEASDFAIDGSIFVLKQNGTVEKYLSGVKEAFELKNIPPPMPEINPIAIFTNARSDGLYVADSIHNRIVVFDKEGNYIKQYVIESGPETIERIYVDESRQSLYVMSGTKVYKIGL